MAKMIPEVDPSQLEHASEEPVYQSLRDELGNDFIVLHSYPWLRPWRDEGTLSEGEADFVVLHPQHGILVLEVKGGKSIRHDGHRWWREKASGFREFQDPFRQAQRNMHALLDIIVERTGGRITKRDFTHGYAVVFPHVDYEGTPPPHADKAIIISRRHLPFMSQAVQTAYKGWGGEQKAIPRERFSVLLDCLMPKFKIFRPVGPDISTASERLLELTEQQAQVFEGLYIQDRVLVEGIAGSGKTILALQRALAFARNGKRTLFVCYNRELARWLDRQVSEDPRAADIRSLLTIRNFHALASELAEAAGLSFEPAGGGAKDDRFWDEEVPDLLEQAVLGLELTGDRVRYDALVVDEAQDFSLGWWYSLTHSLLTGPAAPIYAFMDPNQSLRGDLQAPPVEFQARFKLTINCRNTKKIAVASASVLELRHDQFLRAPTGISPRLVRANSPAQQKGLVLQELRRLLSREDVQPSQIAVIGPSSKTKGSLADVDEVEGIPLVTSADVWKDGGGILVTTTRAFKGLEADVVVIYDLGDFGRLFHRGDLYVACSRAKVLLVAVVHGGASRGVLNAAFDMSEATS